MKGRLTRMHLPRIPLLTAVIAALVLVVGTLVLPVQAQEEETPAGYEYTVQEGDSWATVAARTGVSIAVLQELNPSTERENDWLLSGETLLVPFEGNTGVREHVVSGGESWASIAAQYGIPVSLLEAANPQSVRASSVLYKGERLAIPPYGTSYAAASEEEADEAEPADAQAATDEEEAATEESTDEPEVVVEETPEAEPASPSASDVTTITVEVATEEPAPGAQTEEDTVPAVEPGESEVVTVTIPVTDTAGATSGDEATEPMTDTAESGVIQSDCPEKFTEYPEILLDIISSAPVAADAVADFLTGCEALAEDGLVVADLTGNGVEDLVVVYQNPQQETSFVEADLIIFNGTDEGYDLGYRARAAGEVRLLATEDVNEDGLIDVVWVDTTCGASTCFDTVNVRSWDGSAWRDWTDGTITMAYAEIDVVESTEVGQGREIVLSGGIYGSVGAGPQRSRVEVWASADGEPYSLVEKSYNPSECLYHTVLDANRAFLEGPDTGFGNAEELYNKAATDETLIKCWVRSDELEELRSFSLFRLALIAGYQDQADVAAQRIAELGTIYPESVYDEVGQVWLESYEASGSASAACEETTAFVEENPAAWEILADYGYTNPSFEAVDVCPLLAMGSPEGDPEGTEGEGDTGEPEGDTQASSAVSGGLPDCPADLAGYADVLPTVLEVAAGDQASIENWMVVCGVMEDDRGGVVLADLNDDGVQDAIVFPTLITDLGFGPDGAQGAVLVYHSMDSGGYELIASPEIYGQPAPLAVDDLNDDGRWDVAWTVVGCSTFCVLEVQMWTWDGDAYVSLIRPGATIADGEAMFEPVPSGDLGDGQQLVLVGGVSGTSEGGLAVPHAEYWQSMDAGLYQRIGWRYDRTVEGSECMGLRLVEADVALQASPVLGYEPAIDLYMAALDPALAACSIFGIPADEELILLQGLATFRLIQAQALSGDLEGAQASLAALEAGQPGSEYAEAASTWLAAYQTSGDAQAACLEIQSVFDENLELWQITDHFGYNHPALAPEQVCYIP